MVRVKMNWGNKVGEHWKHPENLIIIENEWFRAMQPYSDSEIEYAIIEAVDTMNFPPCIAEFCQIIFDKRDADSVKRRDEMKQLRYEAQIKEEKRLDSKIDKKKRAENSRKLAEIARGFIKRVN